MYSFMKIAGFTHMNLEGITECWIVVIIGGKLQKFEMDGEILNNHKIYKLELKLYLSSHMNF